MPAWTAEFSAFVGSQDCGECGAHVVFEIGFVPLRATDGEPLCDRCAKATDPERYMRLLDAQEGGSP